MYPNVPKKMRKNDFKLTACPKPKTLFAKSLGLTMPDFPSGQDVVIDVDPVVALNRATQADYEAYVASMDAQQRKALEDIEE